MKKILVLFLAITMLLTVFTACGKKEPMESAGEVSDLSEEKHFGISDILQNGDTSEEQSGDETSSEESLNPSESITSQNPGTFSGEFIVSEKKYTYKNENLMLLQVKNDTDTHYDLTINGKYLDADGNTIKEESQTYHAFPSGWENYFIFRPKGTFDDFDYTLEVKKYQINTEIDRIYSKDGEPYSTYVQLTYDKNLYWAYAPDNWRDLRFNMQVVNNHPNISLFSQFHIIVLDEQGEIYTMDYEYASGGYNGTYADPIGGDRDGRTYAAVGMQKSGEDETIPDTVQGKFTAIFAIGATIDYFLGTELWQKGVITSDMIL